MPVLLLLSVYIKANICRLGTWNCTVNIPPTGEPPPNRTTLCPRVLDSLSYAQTQTQYTHTHTRTYTATQ